MNGKGSSAFARRTLPSEKDILQCSEVLRTCQDAFVSFGASNCLRQRLKGNLDLDELADPATILVHGQNAKALRSVKGVGREVQEPILVCRQDSGSGLPLAWAGLVPRRHRTAQQGPYRRSSRAAYEVHYPDRLVHANHTPPLCDGVFSEPSSDAT